MNEPFQNLQFFLHLRRRTLYYAFNLLLPCTLIMTLVLLGFTLNPYSCEKVGLQISVTLAITIFMTILAGMTPQTSESVPLLGVFFQSCMIISVCATAFTVYVQSVHFRCHGNSKKMSPTVSLIFVINTNQANCLDAIFLTRTYAFYFVH